jgi:heat shock protein HslJ
MQRLTAAMPLAFVMIAGCTAMPAASDAPSLDGTAWVLSALPGSDLVAGAPATLRFEGGRAAGSDGCNRYTVDYTTRGAAIDLPERAASTQMACPPNVMKQAQAFMTALGGAKSYRIENGRLQLLSADGTMRATLVAQSQSLAGTTWRVTGINNGKGAVASVVAGSTVTMAFTADGRASGSAGCNQYTAGYAADGSRLRFTTPASTRKMCAGEGLMEQEQMFLKALESVATMRVEGNRLEMRNAQGALLVSATQASGG